MSQEEILQDLKTAAYLLSFGKIVPDEENDAQGQPFLMELLNQAIEDENNMEKMGHMVTMKVMYEDLLEKWVDMRRAS